MLWNTYTTYSSFKMNKHIDLSLNDMLTAYSYLLPNYKSNGSDIAGVLSIRIQPSNIDVTFIVDVSLITNHVWVYIQDEKDVNEPFHLIRELLIEITDKTKHYLKQHRAIDKMLCGLIAA